MIAAFSNPRTQRRQTNADGSLPLSVQYNSLISRDPSTLKYANEGYMRNSIVHNCITRRAQGIQMAPFKVYDKNNEWLPKSQLQQLLDLPNDYIDGGELWQYTEIYVDIGGRAYWHLVRDKRGIIRNIFPYHAAQMKALSQSDQWISGYRYDNGMGYIKFIPPEDIIAFKWCAINLFQPYDGFSPMMALAKEVDIDNEAGGMEVALLSQAGVPSFVIYPGKGSEDDIKPMTQDELDATSERIMTKINGRNRGRPLTLNFGAKLEKMGFSPREMANTMMRSIPETRICAEYGVPVGYAQMLTGLQYAGTYANRETDKRAFFEDTMVGCWKQYPRAVKRGFKNESFLDGKGNQYNYAFDYKDIPSLMEASEKIQQRVTDQWRFDLIPRKRALELLSEPPLDKGDPRAEEYYSQSTGTAYGTAENPLDKPTLSIHKNGKLIEA